MDVLFLDANVLFSAAYKEDSRVRRFWELDEVELLTSAYVLEEVGRNLSGEERHERLAHLLKSLRIVPELTEPAKVSALLPQDLSLPDDDLPILLSAIEARASHLITGDVRDFGKLFGREIAGVRVVPPVEYFRARDRQERKAVT